jgi:hypothetical protein
MVAASNPFVVCNEPSALRILVCAREQFAPLAHAEPIAGCELCVNQTSGQPDS